MGHPIICGVDATDASLGAARVAEGLAEALALPLVYVHVAPAGETGASALDRVRRVVAGTCHGRLDGGWALERGRPGARLVAAAAARAASFIVIGCRGAGGSVLESVSAEVARRACCPVVVVCANAPAADQGWMSPRRIA